jgi:hypothetical protein
VERLSALGVLAALLLGATPVVAAPPVPYRPMVVEVDLRLPPGEDPAALRPLLAVQAGQPLTPQATQLTVRALYLTGKCANVEVITYPAAGTPETPRVRVEVHCAPRRAAASVKVEGRGGALPVSEAALLQAASLPKGAEIYAGRLRPRRGPCGSCWRVTATGRPG